jgi:hypothetical protein
MLRGHSAPSADLPDGQITDFAVQPPLQKYSASPQTKITFIESPSRSEEGRWPSSRTLGRDAVDAAASGAQVVAGRVSRERSDGVPTNDAEADGEVVWS